MAFVPVPNTAQANIRYLQGGQQIQNSIYFQLGTPWTPLLLSSLAGNVRAEWITHVMPTLSAGVSLVDVHTVDISDDTGPVGDATGAVVPGGVTDTNPLPNHVTFAIKFTTSARGPGARGRIYLPGPSDAGVTGNTLTIGYAEDLRDGVAAACGAIETGVGAGCIHVVPHRFEGGVPLSVGLARGVTGYGFTDLVVDSQRRRLPGRGR